VVSLDHGCGAHSDVRIEPSPVPVTDMLVDETTFIHVRVDRTVEDEQDALAPHSDEVGADHAARSTAAEVESQDVLGAAQSLLQTSTTSDDVHGAEGTDEDAGEGNIAPPQDLVLFEQVAKNEAEQGE
jgi:hypothetical protein